MFKCILLHRLRCPITTKRQDILNPFILKNSGEVIYLILVIMKTGKMYHRLYTVLELYLLCKFDGSVII